MSVAPNEPRYQIEASTFRCTACGEEIPCEAPYQSAVLFEPVTASGGGFLRQDYCLRCWQGSHPTAFAHWRTKRPPKPEDKPRRLRLDTVLLLDFFRRLEGEGGPEGPALEDREELRFVIALLLVRKKVLAFESSCQQDGSEWLKLVERSDPPRTHWTRNPELSDDQLERVKVRIGDLLQMQL